MWRLLTLWPCFVGKTGETDSFVRKELCFKKPYIKDVHRKGGRGVGPKEDKVREVAWI